MKRARYTEEQIIGVLKEHEAGAKTADLARTHGVSEATLYNWKAKFGEHGCLGGQAVEAVCGGECQAEQAASRANVNRRSNLPPYWSGPLGVHRLAYSN